MLPVKRAEKLKRKMVRIFKRTLLLKLILSRYRDFQRKKGRLLVSISKDAVLTTESPIETR